MKIGEATLHTFVLPFALENPVVDIEYHQKAHLVLDKTTAELTIEVEGDTTIVEAPLSCEDTSLFQNGETMIVVVLNHGQDDISDPIFCPVEGFPREAPV